MACYKDATTCAVAGGYAQGSFLCSGIEDCGLINENERLRDLWQPPQLSPQKKQYRQKATEESA